MRINGNDTLAAAAVNDFVDGDISVGYAVFKLNIAGGNQVISTENDTDNDKKADCRNQE
jgi:hypothetical protein